MTSTVRILQALTIFQDLSEKNNISKYVIYYLFVYDKYIIYSRVLF